MSETVQQSMQKTEARSSGLAVMYHYVRADEESVPAGIRPMRVNEFETQLDWLESHYVIAQPAAFLKWIAGEIELPKPPCLLTFDDGTRDHAQVVTPILARRKLGGVFFVLSGPAEEGLMPLTHAIHWLLGQPDEQVWGLFERYAREELGGAGALGDPAEAKRIYHYETELRGRIKYAANMALPADATAAIVHRATEKAGITLAELARQWFVSAEEIGAMHRAGMTIGLHGHSHSSLQVMGEAGIEREITHGSAFLKSLSGEAPTWWACPFGGSGAGDNLVSVMQRAMQKAGLTAAVTTRKAPVMCGSRTLEIPRFDCIDLPPRKTPALAELEAG